MIPHFNENKFYNHIEEYCSAFLMFAMLLLLFGQVVMRFVLSTSSPVIEEYSLYMFLYFVYFLSSNAFLRDEHIKIEALSSRLPQSLQLGLVVLIHLANILFSVIIVKYGMERVINQFEMGTRSATLFPLWIQAFSLPLGMACSLIRSVQYIFLVIKVDVFKKEGTD